MGRLPFYAVSAAAVAIFGFSGCSAHLKNGFPDPSNPVHAPDGVSGDRVDGSVFQKRDVYGNLDEYINGGKLESDSEVSPSSVVRIVDTEDEPPSDLLKRKVQKMEIFGTKLGDALKLILSDVDVNMLVEPNVDLNAPVNVKLHDVDLYDALKKTALSAGYAVRYDALKDAVIVSRYVERKYYVPAEVFTQRTADVDFGSSDAEGGKINPSIDMNAKSPKDILLKDVLGSIGTKEKIVSFDEQAGVITVKERPNYIDEIDGAIKDFVAERTEQFEVEFVVAEMSEESLKKFGMNLYDLRKRDFKISSLGGAIIGSNIVQAIKSYGGVVISGWDGYASDDSRNPTDRDSFAFKFLMDALQKSGVAQIVEKPNVIVQNHSIGYISVGEENSYVKKIKTNVVTTNGVTTTVTDPEIGKYRDGLQFVVRVDKYRRKDRIGLTIVPMMAVSSLRSGPGNVQLLDRKIRQAMSVVAVRNGDVIVLGGMKLKNGTGDDTGMPGVKSIPLLGSLFGQKGENSKSVETVFIVRVKKVRRASETSGIPSLKTKALIRSVE